MAQIQIVSGLALAAAIAGGGWLMLDTASPAAEHRPALAAGIPPHSAAASLDRPALTTVATTDAAALPSAHGAGQVPSSELWDALQQQSGLDAQWLQAHGFTPGSLALERLHSLLDGQKAVHRASAKQIAFGPQGSTAHPTTHTEEPILSTHERYVDASLPTANIAGDSVLLRWRNMSDNQVMDLSAQALPSVPGDSMPLWMYSPADWAPGRYRVEVLSPDASLNLLAAGEVSIAASGGAVTPFSYEAHGTPASVSQ